MRHSLKTPSTFKQYGRFILALFVMSVINMSVQLPAHAAMQLKMSTSSMQMQGLSNDMTDCDCPPAMCESVASQADKSIENLFANYANSMPGFQTAYSSRINDFHHQISLLQLFERDRYFREYAPPPLSLNTVLHI